MRVLIFFTDTRLLPYFKRHNLSRPGMLRDLPTRLYDWVVGIASGGVNPDASPHRTWDFAPQSARDFALLAARKR